MLLLPLTVDVVAIVVSVVSMVLVVMSLLQQQLRMRILLVAYDHPTHGSCSCRHSPICRCVAVVAWVAAAASAPAVVVAARAATAGVLLVILVTAFVVPGVRWGGV